MNKIQLILLISIIVVILLLIDAFRRSKRKKYQKQMAALETAQQDPAAGRQSASDYASHPPVDMPVSNVQKDKLDSQKRSEKCKQSPAFDKMLDQLNQRPQVTYPALEQGYAVLYLSAPRGYEFAGSDLAKHFEHLVFSFDDEKGSFQFFTEDGDVLLSVIPEGDQGKFRAETLHESAYAALACIFNGRKLAKLYDVSECLTHFFHLVESLNKSLGGVMLNEHKRRFGLSDEHAYRAQITRLKQREPALS